LNLCLAHQSVPPDLLGKALTVNEGRAFLSTVVEYLADLFEPKLAKTYATLFTQAITLIAPELSARVRTSVSKPLPARAERVYVLSRITLGADIAVTSVLMDAAKRRYPEASIVFVGPPKNYELFAADSRIEHRPVPYARSGSLKDRLEASAALWFDDGIVIDPDSRLTQLGLLRVCPDDRYAFFDSRSFGGTSLERLPNLAARWAGDTHAKPWVAPLAVDGEPMEITVSLGVGENLGKRLPSASEAELMKALVVTGKSILIDSGASIDEQARVERAVKPFAGNAQIRVHNGPFAHFAAEIARSKLFVGYDSAGGHVASACGVSLISIARGFLSERMAARWRPLGTIIDAQTADPLPAIRAALAAS
jgi:ADP-heptose:LPS heptosyltransferase